MKKGKFNCIVDSAFGSSAKTAASTRLVDIYKVPNVSACNFQNAGHTASFDGEAYIFKALPGPSILRWQRARDDIRAWIGPNSGFFRDQFEKEIGWTNTEIGETLFIHDRAVFAGERHKEMEKEGRFSTLHVSSTMSGAGAAFVEKAMRTPEVETLGSLGIGIPSWEFYKKVWTELSVGNTFMHEVSQGFALSINAGVQYPFNTFRECTPQQAYADFGIKPEQVGEVYLNVRSFIIRVGNSYDDDGKMIGYSGDTMPDSQELSWEQIGKNANMPQDEIEQLSKKEIGSVTKRMRRCFTQSWELLRFSAKFCGATKLILNFPQYIEFSSYKKRGGWSEFYKLHPKVRAYIDKMQEVTNLPVVMIGTSAEHEDYIWLGD